MGGKASRNKGAGGEREIVLLLKARGYTDARRAAYSGAMAHEKGDVVGLPGHHVEVKRCEKLSLPAWTRQAESQAKPEETAIVVYRSSNEPWRVSLPFDAYLDLIQQNSSVGAQANGDPK